MHFLDVPVISGMRYQQTTEHGSSARAG